MAGRHIHQITLAEFLGPAQVNHDIAVSGDEFCSVFPSAVDLSMLESADSLIGYGIPDPGHDLASYAIAPLKRTQTDLVALTTDEFEDWVVVGQYIGTTLMVDPEHRGKGLGTLLVIATAKARGGLIGATEYTVAGEITHRKAHRAAIGNALHQYDSGNGDEWAVPEEVLADYPDLLAGIPKPVR